METNRSQFSGSGPHNHSGDLGPDNFDNFLIDDIFYPFAKRPDAQ